MCRFYFPWLTMRISDAWLVDHNGIWLRPRVRLPNVLFQTACRLDEVIQLKWEDCQTVGKEIVALRIKGKGSVFQDLPGAWVRRSLSGGTFRRASRERESFPSTDRVYGILRRTNFQPRVQFATALRLSGAGGGETAHGLRHSAATIFVNHVEKGLREIQELLRHKNIRTPCAKPRGYEQTRQTAEALSRPLGLLASKAPRPPKASSSRIRRHLPAHRYLPYYGGGLRSSRTMNYSWSHSKLHHRVWLH
jgi:Phage integrase family.